MTGQSNGRLGIGILAHNEAARLPVLFESLFKQSIFEQATAGVSSIHVACVPNGCTDDTAAVARRGLDDAVARVKGSKVTWAIDDLAEPGKANAWNHCVHTSLADCEYLCLLDADIVFANDATIAAALAVLIGDPRVCVVTDQPVKRHEASSGWLAGLSRYFSRTTPAGPTEICGQFYCARADILHGIWLPPGLPVEDGFLRAMVITDEFRKPEDPHRITRAAEAAHYFEPKTHPRDLWRHKKRLMIGTTLNCLLFQYLWKHAGEDGAGKLLRDKLQRDPAWLDSYLSQESRRLRWVVPMGHVLRRLVDLRAVPLSEAMKKAPVAVVATALDLAAAVSANREIKRNLGLGFW
jgi:hypothetical protein